MQAWSRARREDTTRLAVVKLGGSIVTVKDKPYTVNISLVSEYAKLLRELERQGWSFLLVLGGGSYGHTTVSMLRSIGAPNRELFAITTTVMIELALVVADIMQGYGVQASVYPPHAFCRPEGLNPNCDWSLVATALEHGITPILYGDVYLGGEGVSIVSGDELAAEAACKLGAEVLVYLANVPGVLDEKGRPIACLDLHQLKKALEGLESWLRVSRDETGGMRRKLQAILANWCNIPTYIVDGRDPAFLRLLLGEGKPVGTMVSTRC